MVGYAGEREGQLPTQKAPTGMACWRNTKCAKPHRTPLIVWRETLPRIEWTSGNPACHARAHGAEEQNPMYWGVQHQTRNSYHPARGFLPWFDDHLELAALKSFMYTTRSLLGLTCPRKRSYVTAEPIYRSACYTMHTTDAQVTHPNATAALSCLS